MESKALVGPLLFVVGLFIGWPILDLDRVFVKYLATPTGLFRGFGSFMFIFVLAIFVITASSSMLGKGVVLGLLAHGIGTIQNINERRLALGLLGVAISLVIL